MSASLIDPILRFQQERKVVEFQPPVVCGESAFPLLLAGVPALRITPGLATLQDLGKDFFTSIPYPRDEEGLSLARAHLKQVFGITDRDSLVAFCQENIHVHQQYLDFESFWDGRPAFDLNELTDGGREVFAACSDFARQFRPIVGRRGFLAWDISETLGHLRAACACRLITREEFGQLARHWVEQAAAFRSWDQFALDLVCGGAYWSFRTGSSEEDTAAYIDLNLRLVRQLLNDKRAWCGRLWWHKPGEKRFALSAPELRQLLTGWDGQPGCLATDHITVLGKPVGWCYREETDGKFPDSGWRFFSGEEDDAYVSDPAHTGIYSLNTICNYDPDIIPLLSAPYGTAYARGADGAFRAEPYAPPEE